MTQAIALAATSIGGLMVAANTSVAREYHAGLSAMLGIHAALAAHKGFVAEEHVLEMPRGFFSAYGGDHLEDVTKDLGAEWDIATNMAVKLVPGGHPHHAAAEAAANAAIAGNVDPADVAGIVLSSAKYRTLPGPKHPTDLIGVAHSPAYFIAAAVADRGYGWIHASPAKVADPVIGALIDKITVDPNPPPYPDRFPHHHGATVTITLKDGRQFSDHVDFPRGSAPRGIEWADVDAKYRALVPLSGLAPSKVEASLEVIHELKGQGHVGARSPADLMHPRLVTGGAVRPRHWNAPRYRVPSSTHGSTRRCPASSSAIPLRNGSAAVALERALPPPLSDLSLPPPSPERPHGPLPAHPHGPYAGGHLGRARVRSGGWPRAAWDANAILWDLGAGHRARRPTGDALRVRSASIDHRGSMAATSSDDHSVILWNVATGKRARVLEGHTIASTVSRWPPMAPAP